MSEKMEQVSTNSLEFKEGVEAGLNSREDTKNWQAGNELGRQLKGGDIAPDAGFSMSSSPLFMKGNPGGARGNAQDEKDGTEE